MAQPRARHDRYGRPLPTLAPVPATAPSVTDSAHNQRMRAYLLDLLTEQYADLYQRGVHAHLTITLAIMEGSLQPDIDIQVTQHYRLERGER